MQPAERADVIIDFSQVPAGSKLILYNDGPAPTPGFDPRYDYYTGNPDFTSTGGAPTTLAGYGPNTRTIMQFQVAELRLSLSIWPRCKIQQPDYRTPSKFPNRASRAGIGLWANLRDNLQ